MGPKPGAGLLYMDGYDTALAEGAAAVSAMQEKLDEARRTLAAVVLAAGGKVEVMNRSIIDSYGATLMFEDTPQIGGITVTAKRQK
jgi:hypothetical protein